MWCARRAGTFYRTRRFLRCAADTVFSWHLQNPAVSHHRFCFAVRQNTTFFIIYYLFFIICIYRIPCISAILILFPIEGKNDTPPARGLYFAGKDKTQCHTSLKFKT